MMIVDPRLQALYERAEKLAESGDHAAALALYEEIVASEKAGAPAAPSFLQLVHREIARELLEVGRFAHALEALQCMRRINEEWLDEGSEWEPGYDYLFLFGDACGYLHRHAECEEALLAAVADAEHMGDLHIRPKEYLRALLEHERRDHEWTRLARNARLVLAKATERGWQGTRSFAQEMLDEARARSGRRGV
jgi:hypothetical protein